jgi:carboxypeptidase family protein
MDMPIVRVAVTEWVALPPSALYAHVALAGTVKDASSAVLPDATGQYRIESLQPGTYTVTFTLAGFATLKRDEVILSGTGVIKIDADMKVGGVQKTVIVTGESPMVDLVRVFNIGQVVTPATATTPDPRVVRLNAEFAW